MWGQCLEAGVNLLTGARRSRRGLSLVEVLVTVAIVGLLVGLLMPALQSARESARRVTCQNNLKQIGLALSAHDSHLNGFPYAWGGPLTSGTIVSGSLTGQLSGFYPILPFMDERGLYDAFGMSPPVAWTGSFAPYATQLRWLLCPSDTPPDRNINGGSGKNNYVFCFGDRYSSLDAVVSANKTALRGVFGRDSRTQAADIRDGLGMTLAMAECIRPTFSSSATPKPENNSAACSSSNSTNPVNCRNSFNGGVFTSGALLSDYGSPGTQWTNGRPEYNGFCTVLPPNDACCASSANGLITTKSRHQGGVQSLFADGAVRFISENIDCGTIVTGTQGMGRSPSPFGVWGALGSKAGGEAISPLDIAP